MAKVTIVIEDIENGLVKCEATPNVTQMINLERGAAGLTAAQAYALHALLAIRDVSRKSPVRETQREHIILLPGSAARKS